jgi:hypothetical protein
MTRMPGVRAGHPRPGFADDARHLVPWHAWQGDERVRADQCVQVRIR